MLDPINRIKHEIRAMTSFLDAIALFVSAGTLLSGGYQYNGFEITGLYTCLFPRLHRVKGLSVARYACVFTLHTRKNILRI